MAKLKGYECIVEVACWAKVKVLAENEEDAEQQAFDASLEQDDIQIRRITSVSRIEKVKIN